MAARLLAKTDGPSRVEKEEILDAVLEKSGPARRRPRMIFGFAAALATAAAVGLFALRPPEFTARGAEEAISVEVGCGGGDCTQGARLLFDVTADPKYKYFAAFARRPDGAVVWYFPERDGALSPEISQLSAIVLGSEHVPGDYTLTAIVSERPLDRSAIKEGASGTTLRSVERLLKIR